MLLKAVVLVLFTLNPNGSTRVQTLGSFPTASECQAKSALILGAISIAGDLKATAICAAMPWPFRRTT
jgi:hypothetical protein